MFFSRPIELYYFQADIIWPDITFQNDTNYQQQD